LYKSLLKDIYGSVILVSGSCSLLRIERFSVASFFNFNYQFKSDVVEAVTFLQQLLLNETISLVPEVGKVRNYCFIDFRDKLMLKDRLS